MIIDFIAIEHKLKGYERAMRFFSFFFTLFLSASTLIPDVHAQDIENGYRIFRRCVACHYADKNANKVGPTLLGVIGRTAGTAEGYRYSPAMVDAGKNGLIWSKESLTAYLHDPRGMIKGTRMAAVKIKNDQEIDDLLAYLKSVTDKP
ncbi:c-type cytochrome [Bartonella sp. LJL80]